MDNFICTTVHIFECHLLATFLNCICTLLGIYQEHGTVYPDTRCFPQLGLGFTNPQSYCIEEEL